MHDPGNPKCSSQKETALARVHSSHGDAVSHDPTEGKVSDGRNEKAEKKDDGECVEIQTSEELEKVQRVLDKCKAKPEGKAILNAIDKLVEIESALECLAHKDISDTLLCK